MPPPEQLIQDREAIAKVADAEKTLKVRVIGPAGAGKTSLLAATAERLHGRFRIGLIVANATARRDAQTIRKSFPRVAAIESADPKLADVQAATKAFGATPLDIVLIESGGGATPYASVGEDVTAAMFGLTGGDDKAAEYRSLVRNASAVLLGKTDLRRYVRFDFDAFGADVRRLNPTVPVLEISLHDKAGLGAWLAWLSTRIEAARACAVPQVASRQMKLSPRVRLQESDLR